MTEDEAQQEKPRPRRLETGQNIFILKRGNAMEGPRVEECCDLIISFNMVTLEVKSRNL